VSAEVTAFCSAQKYSLTRGISRIANVSAGAIYFVALFHSAGAALVALLPPRWTGDSNKEKDSVYIVNILSIVGA